MGNDNFGENLSEINASFFCVRFVQRFRTNKSTGTSFSARCLIRYEDKSEDVGCGGADDLFCGGVGGDWGRGLEAVAR